jgi:hypothetical protein
MSALDRGIMGFNDHSHSNGGDLPPEAGNFNEYPFDPNDEWIKNAPEEQQIEAMRRWFHARFEDPSNQTPYDGGEGGFQFIWGGPYDPNDKIQERFSSVVEYEVMEKLIKELWQEAGDEWAPIEHEGLDYDEELSFRVVSRDDPLRLLEDRISQIEDVLDWNNDPHTSQLVHQMVHSSLIAALEAFLADTMAFWVRTDKGVLRQFTSENKDFKGRQLTLDQLFERLEKLDQEVEIYLQDMLWHRLDKIRPMMTAGLGIAFPDIGDLMREVVVRHDIVHRAGRTKSGELVSVSTDDAIRVRDEVRRFARAIVAELEKRFRRTVEPAEF